MKQRLGKLKSSTSDGLVRNSWVVSFVHCCNVQWQIQYFPLEEGSGAPTPNMGVPTYFLATFPPKLHENENKIGRGRGNVPSACLDPPMLSYTYIIAGLNFRLNYIHAIFFILWSEFQQRYCWQFMGTKWMNNYYIKILKSNEAVVTRNFIFELNVLAFSQISDT